MGVFGLTSYISKNASEYLVDYRLHDGVVIIDGNAAASLIYSNLTQSNHAFGGDYDRYAQSTTEFVQLFARCNMHPIFVIDGGYEQRKLKTVIERIKLNIVICGQYKHKYRESRSFPLLLRDAFKMILRDLGVLVIQCDFEADHEIVTLAKLMNCPVISNDSDFYISDVQYIPFSTIEFKTVGFKKKTCNRKHYIPCKKFCTDKFLDRLGGLKDKSLLPLLSCALGNDYIPQNTFKNFLDLNRLVKFDDRIRKIVRWLRTVSSVDEAVQEMVSTLGRNQRTMRDNMKRLVHEHNRQSSELLSSIPVELMVSSVLLNNNHDRISIDSPRDSAAYDCNAVDDTLITIRNGDDVADHNTSNAIDVSVVNASMLDPVNVSNYEDANESSEDDVIVLDVEEFDILDSASESETEETSNESTIVNDFHAESHSLLAWTNPDETVAEHCHKMPYDFEIPPWVLEKFRTGLISPTVMNILNFQRIFIPSQSEDYFSHPSHEICLPVLQFVVGIVLGDESTVSRVQCHARVKNMQIGVFHIEPIVEVPSGRLPTLGSVSRWSPESRMAVLLECLNIPRTTKLNLFPEPWRLYIITLMYWKKNCQQSMVNGSHLRALFVCLIYLSVIDQEIGFARTVGDLKKLRKAAKVAESKLTVPVLESTEVDKHRSFTQCMNSISKADCFKAADSLLRYHQMDENLLKNRKQFNVKLVHAFAQLQHCIQSIILLNSVLDFPFVQYSPHLVFSGTFLYNFQLEMHNRKLADGYITRTLLAKANTVISLYRYLIASWETCTAVKEQQPAVKKRKSRRRKVRCHGSNHIEEVDECGEEYEDPDNIFSILPME